MHTRSRFPTRPLALSFSLVLSCAAAPALAQRLAGPGSGNGDTLVTPTRPLPGGGVVRNLPGRATATLGQVETQAVVSAAITQTSSDRGAAEQTTLIGAVDRLQGSVDSLTTRAVVSGAVTQSMSGFADEGPARPQAVAIGSVSGTVDANTVLTSGTAIGAIQQSSSRFGGRGGEQAVDIGGVVDAGGNRLSTEGLLTSTGSILQGNGSGARQTVQLASIRRSLVQTAETAGVIAGQVTQIAAEDSAAGAGGNQRLSVGAIAGSVVQNARTSGLLRSNLVQSSAGDVQQSIDIGAVNEVVGGGSVVTQATADVGTITQTLFGSGGAAQTLSLGSVAGGSPVFAQTRAQLDRDVSQLNTSGGAGDLQRIAVGSVDNAQGRVDAEGVVTDGLQQTITGGGSGRVQEISVGAVDGTDGTVTTRARVTRPVTQNLSAAGRFIQTVRLGSVQGIAAGTVRTDVQVSGAIVQTAGEGSTGSQSVLIGTVSGAPPSGVVTDPS